MEKREAERRERTERWFTYPQTQHIDTPGVLGLLAQHVNIEEKIDGDLIAFRVHDDQLEMVPPLSPEMEPVVSHLQANQYQLNPDNVYFIELLSEAQGTILTYGRAPRGGAILVDVRTPDGWLDHEQKFQTAEQLGFECAPLLYQGHVVDPDQLLQIFQQESLLGGVMEGIIIKPVSGAGKFRFAKLINTDYLVRKTFTRMVRELRSEVSPRDINMMLRSAQGQQVVGGFPPRRQGDFDGPGREVELPDSDL